MGGGDGSTLPEWVANLSRVLPERLLIPTWEERERKRAPGGATWTRAMADLKGRVKWARWARWAGRIARTSRRSSTFMLSSTDGLRSLVEELCFASVME